LRRPGAAPRQRRVDTTHTEQFDTVYMKKLYDYGYNLAFTGTLWHKALPNP
jgi:hypothetical protein